MSNHDAIELAFVAVAALALVCQTILLLSIVLAAGKAAKAVKAEIDDLRETVMPVVHRTRDMVDRLSPKFEQTVTDVSEIAGSARRQVADFEVVASEVMGRVRAETGRIDTMFSGTLDAVDRAGNFVTQTLSKPVKQISGILASAKAIIESLRTNHAPYSDPGYGNQNNHHGYRDDSDMFV
jgi:methyl-accepting chemotaxis protein